MIKFIKYISASLTFSFQHIAYINRHNQCIKRQYIIHCKTHTKSIKHWYQFKGTMSCPSLCSVCLLCLYYCCICTRILTLLDNSFRLGYFMFFLKFFLVYQEEPNKEILSPLQNWNISINMYFFFQYLFNTRIDQSYIIFQKHHLINGDCLTSKAIDITNLWCFLKWWGYMYT